MAGDVVDDGRQVADSAMTVEDAGAFASAFAET
jgi:hypothetical protein